MAGPLRSLVIFSAIGGLGALVPDRMHCPPKPARAFLTTVDPHTPDTTTFGGSIAGEWVQLPCSDGSSTKAWLVPAAEKTDRWLFLFHPWWGLNDETRTEASRLATELGGTNVLCPDLFKGKTSTDRNGAAALMGSLSKEYARTVVSAAEQYVGHTAEVATMGWGMGATFSLQAAIALGDRGSGCVFYYGMPEEDPLLLAGSHGPVLGIFAEDDAVISTDVVNRFAKNMAKAGKQLEVETYKADNGFADPSDPSRRSRAARSADARAIAFLANVLHLANDPTKP